MNVSTKTFLVSLFCIVFTLPLFSENIAIIESQSFHPNHKMDQNWRNATQRLGHGAEIFDKNVLSDPQALCDFDIIIISSGLTELNTEQHNNLTQYIQSGIHAYLQSEYLMSTPGNILFKGMVEHFGGTFDWDQERNGNISPMNVLANLGSSPNTNLQLDYFWYGVSGIGDQTIMPFLEHNNKNYGFVFSSPMPSYGKIMTITDQDWIRVDANPMMLENMLTYFLNNPTDTSMPNLLIDADEEMPCAGTTITFTATTSFTMPNSILQWMKNGVDISGENSNVYITSDLLMGDVIECRLERQLFCDQRTVQSNPILVAVHGALDLSILSIEADQLTICANESIEFMIRPSNYPDAQNIRLQWMIDGQPVTGATDSIFVAQNLYTNAVINCRFTFDDLCDPNQEALSESLTVQVNSMIRSSASILSDLNDICAGETITFSILGQNLGTQPQYQWLINGTNTYTTTSPFFTSSDLEDGDLVSCIVVVDQVCAAQPTVVTENLSIRVIRPVTPTASIIADRNRICDGEIINFTASGQHLGTAPTYQWLIDGVAAGSNSANFSSPISGLQEVSCLIISNEGCITTNEANSNSLSIITRPLLEPTISIQSNQIDLCSGDPITFTASGENWGNQPSFQWLVDGQDVQVNISTYTNLNPSYGQKVVCLVTSNEECLMADLAESAAFEIEMSDLAVAILETEAEHCGDGEGLVEVEGTGGLAPYTYLWNNGATDNFISGLSSAEYVVTVTDAKGCTITTSLEIENTNGPVIESIDATTTNCNGYGGTIQVAVEGDENDFTFRWMDEEGQLVGLHSSISDLPAGKYTIGIIDQYGCSVTDSVRVEDINDLTVSNLEVPFLTLGNETVLNPIALSSQALTYEWSPAIGLSCTNCPNPVANPTETTVYTLSISNEYGCVAHSKVVVKVLPNRDLYIPNAFTPNQDGVNDYFTIFGGNNVKRIKSLKIADRWGSILFERNDFEANTENLGWDGSLKGRTMGAGVYMYITEVEFTDGNIEWFKGDISITP